jgi:hypothetical protein
MLLADCHNGATDLCCPTETWLSDRAGVSDRTIRMHLKSLEDAGLIERLYKHGGRGVGRKFAGYDLKIGINQPINKPQNDTETGQDNAVAGSCHGKITSLPRQDTAKPYKEEPEINRKYKPEKTGKDALEEIWPHWSATGRKRSDSKSKLSERLNRLSKFQGLDDIVRGCLKYAKATDPEYHKGLQVFLKSGAWENWISEPQTPAQPNTPDDWEAITASYREHGVWPQTLGPAPHEAGCQLELKKLQAIARRLQGHRWHARIVHNIERIDNSRRIA